MKEILNINLMHPRDMIALIMGRIYQTGLTTTSGGNISVIDTNGDIWISPSGVDKGRLKPSDIVCIKNDDSIEGSHKPSSEFPFHKAIYKIRPDIKAIIHAHPPALVSFSIVRTVPDTNIITQARHVCGRVGYAKYELPGSEALGSNIAEEFKKGYKSVIMENHGTVVGGENLADTFERFETLEFCARTILYGKALGIPRSLSDKEIDAFESQLPPSFQEMEKVDYSSEEKEKRQELCDIVHRACRQGLMISSYGTISTRLSGNDFLITPTDVLRWDLEVKDIVLIREGKREPGKNPSRTTYLHQDIYKKHPEINSVILTQSPYLMAFSVTGAPFNVRTIPESWIFLQDVNLLEFGSHFYGQTTVSDLVSKNCPAVIIKNECVIVTGNKLLQTFDYLEVAEFSAKSLVLCASIGDLVPISNEQVDELRHAFLEKADH